MKKKSYTLLFVIIIFGFTLTFNFTNLDNWKFNNRNIEESNSSIDSQLIDSREYDDVEPTIKTANIKEDSITETSATVEYEIDPGTTVIGEEHAIVEVKLLEKQGSDIDYDHDLLVGYPDDWNETTGEIEVSNLIPGQTYDDWYLAVLTDHQGTDWLTKDISKFTTPKESSFQDITYQTESNSVTIDYQLFIGSDQNGNNFTIDKNTKVILYDDNNQQRGSDDQWELKPSGTILTGTIVVNNLEESTNYSNWYLKTNLKDNKNEDVPVISENISFNTTNTIRYIIWLTILAVLIFIMIIFVIVILILKSKRKKLARRMKEGLDRI